MSEAGAGLTAAERAGVGGVVGLDRLARVGLPLAAAGLAVVVASWLIRPFASGPAGFDTASSAIYFERIVGGHRLEAFVTTTPKPLVTLVAGLLWAIGGDWRLVSWAAIAAFAAAAGLAVVLAWRVAGPLGGPLAGAFAGVALAGHPALLDDVGMAYAVVLAALAWLVAGLALTQPRPRYGLAGLMLMLAVLARVEALVVVAAADACLLWLSFGPFVPPARRPPMRAALLLAGNLALPLMFVHDWLLTGDPLFFVHVSQVAAATIPASAVFTPLQLIHFLAERYAAQLPLVLLALVGLVDLVARRRWLALAGLVSIGGGVAAFLLLLSLRGVYVSDRYPLPIDVAVVFAAAVGAGAFARAVLGEALAPAPGLAVASRNDGGDGAPAEPRLAAVPLAASLLAGVAVAAAVVYPYGPLDTRLRSTLNAERQITEHADLALPALRDGAATVLPVAARGLSVAYPEPPPPPRVAVPVLLRPRLTLELGVPLWAVEGGLPMSADLARVSAGQPMLVYVDRAATPAAAAGRYTALEAAGGGTWEGVAVVPLLVRPDAGIWVIELRPHR